MDLLVNYTSLFKNIWLCNAAIVQSESGIPESHVVVTFPERNDLFSLSLMLRDSLPLSLSLSTFYLY